MLRRLLLLGALVSMFSSPMASAEEIPTAVLGLEANDCPQALADEIAEALRHGIAANRDLKLVNGKDLIEVKLVFSCPDEAPACMAQAGDSLGAKRLIYGNIKRSGNDFAVWLKSLDVKKALLESWVTDTLPRKASSGAGVKIAATRWLAKLTGHAPNGGSLRIAGGAPGAAVVLDGKDVGVLGDETFVLKDVAPGEHEVTIEGPGPKSTTKKVVLASGQTANISLASASQGSLPSDEPPAGRETTAPNSLPKNEPPGVTSAYRVGFWVTLAGTILSTGAAVKYGLDVMKVNKDLDPYRRFPCNGQDGLCDGKNQQMPAVTDPNALAFVARRNADGKHAQKLQWVSIGAASVFGVATGVLFYLGYLDGGEHTTSAPGERYGLRLFPTVDHSSGGVAAEFDF